MALAAGAPLLAGAVPTASPAPWQLRLEAGRRAPTSVTAVNRCAAPHRFELEKGPGLEWLALPAPAAVTVEPAQSGAVPVKVDASHLPAGLYGGLLTVRCLDCAAEPLCTQDRDLIDVRLTVPWAAAELAELEAEGAMTGEIMLVAGAEVPAAELSRIEERQGLRRLRRFSLLSLGWNVAVAKAKDSRRTLATQVSELQREPDLLWAQPSFRFTTAGAAEGGDPLASLQHALRLIGAGDLEASATGRGVLVAVIDSRVDLRHPDLEGQVREHASFLGGEEGSGPDAHGTAIAGIVAARAGNGLGIRGLAPESELLAIEACRRTAPAGGAVCTSEGLARGLDLAIERRARVVNLSLGGPRDPLLGRLVAEAVRRDAVVVAAAGNGGEAGKPSFPAAWPEVVAVSAVDADQALYPAANRGTYVDLVAPGVEVLTTAPQGRFLPATGTSMAAAHVSAAVALLLAARPELRPAEVEALLTSTARDLGPPGRDDAFGAGLLDVKALLRGAGAGLRAPPSTTASLRPARPPGRSPRPAGS